MIITSFLAIRGSIRARIIWLGGLIYLVYTYTVAAFDVRFNSLFLVYVSLLGCSLYALIGSLATVDMQDIRKRFTQKTPVKAVSIYLAILAALFYFLWLSEIISALMEGVIPKSVVDNGTPTNAVHVLDTAWILPAFGITAAGLWRRQPLGYTLAGALLSYCVLLTSAILGIAVSMTQEGYPIVTPQVIMFGLLLAISLGMLIWYLKNLKPVTPWTGNTTS
jgi:hypothetical protein